MGHASAQITLDRYSHLFARVLDFPKPILTEHTKRSGDGSTAANILLTEHAVAGYNAPEYDVRLSLKYALQLTAIVG
jgi:hypothetical protein